MDVGLFVPEVLKVENTLLLSTDKVSLICLSRYFSLPLSKFNLFLISSVQVVCSIFILSTFHFDCCVS